jgi:HTH-type transcriptional regulator / antitoxin MqsA
VTPTGTDPVCSNTGTKVRGDVRSMTLAYKGESITFDMPGWYCHSCGESIHTGADMNLSDRKLNLLKAPLNSVGLPGIRGHVLVEHLD